MQNPTKKGILGTMDDKRRTDTKEKLLTTGVDLFAEQGIQGASIRDICGRVGIRESAFYKHFASKDALVEAIYGEFNRLLDKPFASTEVLSRILDKYTLYDLIWGASRKFLKPEDSLYTRIWLILMGEQFRNHRAAELLNRDSERLRGNLEGFFVFLEENKRIRCQDQSALAAEFAAMLLNAREEVFREVLLRKEPEPVYARVSRGVWQFCLRNTGRPLKPS